MFKSWKLLVLPILVLASACAATTDDEAPPAEYEALFERGGAPTPNTLRGVWGITLTSDGGAADARFRFSEGRLLAGTRCTFTIEGATALTTGRSAGAEITGLDAKTGTFRPSAALAFETRGKDPGLTTKCNGSLGQQTYAFAIEGTTLTLTVEGTDFKQTLTKIRD